MLRFPARRDVFTGQDAGTTQIEAFFNRLLAERISALPGGVLLLQHFNAQEGDIIFLG